MGDRSRLALRRACFVAAMLVFGLQAAPAPAQFGLSNQFDLSDSVYLDEPQSAAKSHLERARQYRAIGQWDEALETLLQVLESDGSHVIAVASDRYVSVRDYCHGEIASLPPEALAMYRGRVDPQAEKWYAAGVEARDAALLGKVVEEAFNSTWGDDALLALGELALEAGDHNAARRYLERIVPIPPTDDAPPPRLAYPDSPLDLASVRARLVCVSILEGAWRRAEDELASYRTLHPGARGRFSGRETDYEAALAALLDEAKAAPPFTTNDDWPTFGGAAMRGKIAPQAYDVGVMAWPPIVLDAAPATDAALARDIIRRQRRVAEDYDSLLSYHPVVVDGRLFVNTPDRVLAFDVATGKPAWGESAVIFPSGAEEGLALPTTPWRHLRRGSLGAPRFTLTVHAGRLFARMGNPLTSRTNDQLTRHAPGYLVCLDLRAQGKLLWRIEPDDEQWAFEGSPVVDGAQVYVAMRRSDVRPQAHAACFDAATGRLRWRRFVCAAETPARGLVDETTSNLLTLDHDTVYFNTNLGAVAALAAEDGDLRWIRRYPRADQGSLSSPAAHFFRDLNPAVVHQGKVIAAPADSERLFALDASTGHLLWATAPGACQAVHLLGVGAGRLAASGDQLYWIDVESGKLVGLWPDGPSPKGYGRGVLAGDRLYWPTREAIHVFEQRTSRLVDRIDLGERSAAGVVSGGNLLFAGGKLLIANDASVVGFSESGGVQPRAEPSIAARIENDSSGEDAESGPQ